MTTVAAAGRTRHGGRLDCGHVAKTADPVFKLDNDDQDGTTNAGNGSGTWVCAVCAADANGPETSK